MSDSDFSGRLPGPVTGRPRRPLSNSESTASCSIRFSLLTMISGAPRSSSRLSRLFRLITRRYRSLRSEVAKRPPSSCTIGRRSGGMTGTASSTMPCGLLVGLAERVDDLEPLERPDLALALAGGDGLAQALHLGLEVEGLQPLLDRGGAHVALEVLAEPVLHLAVEQLVALEVLDLEALEPAPHLVEAVELALRAVAELLHLALGAVLDLAARVGLGALGLEGREVLLELLGALVDLAVATALETLALQVDLRLERGQVAVPRVVVDLR